MKCSKSIKTSIENPGSPDAKPMDDFIGMIDTNMDAVLTQRADIGARQNRVEMMENRLDSQEINAIKQMSENEDIDYEKVITEMITQESIHRAALSVGARIIQPSLSISYDKIEKRSFQAEDRFLKGE